MKGLEYLSAEDQTKVAQLTQILTKAHFTYEGKPISSEDIGIDEALHIISQARKKQHQSNVNSALEFIQYEQKATQAYINKHPIMVG